MNSRGKFGDCTFNLSRRQTDTDERFTPATLVYNRAIHIIHGATEFRSNREAVIRRLPSVRPNVVLTIKKLNDSNFTSL